jgi:hypothetical protein
MAGSRLRKVGMEEAVDGDRETSRGREEWEGRSRASMRYRESGVRSQSLIKFDGREGSERPHWLWA